MAGEVDDGEHSYLALSLAGGMLKMGMPECGMQMDESILEN